MQNNEDGDPIFVERGRPGDEGRACCMGAAGHDKCTCWRVEHDRNQAAAVVPHPDPRVRDSPCDDCACRAGAPEKQGDPRVIKDDLEKLARRGEPFFCHKGMRRPVRERHPDGSVIELDNEHRYDPPRRSDRVPLKADGTPADLCAGWAALYRYYHQEEYGDDE